LVLVRIPIPEIVVASSDAPAREDRSSVESVKMDDVRFVAPEVEADDKKAEAARRSSSRSETVSRELPSDRVEESSESRKKSSAEIPMGKLLAAAPALVAVCAVLTEEKKPDSHDPRRLSGKYPGTENVEDGDCGDLSRVSSCVTQLPPE
jgi:hypothetical protein